MYAGQYRNNPVIESTFSFNTNTAKSSNHKTKPVGDFKLSPLRLNAKTKTVFPITPLVPWLSATSVSKVNYY